MVYGDKEMKITLRIWVLIIVILISLLSIFGMPPLALEKGVMVTSVNQNSTAFQDGLRVGMVILQINGVDIKTLQDYSNAMQSMSNLEENQTQKLIIKTNSIEIINLFTKEVIDDISIKEIPKTRIITGLDLQGGARALVETDQDLSDQELTDLIAVSEQRLNVYGLSDVKFFKVITSSGERLMGIEIAGSSPDDLEELIAKQG